MTTNRWDEIADELPDLGEKGPEALTPDDRRDQYKKKIDRVFMDKIGEKKPGDLHRIFSSVEPEPVPATPVVVQNPVSLGFKIGIGIFLANLVLGGIALILVYACWPGWFGGPAG